MFSARAPPPSLPASARPQLEGTPCMGTCCCVCCCSVAPGGWSPYAGANDLTESQPAGSPRQVEPAELVDGRGPSPACAWPAAAALGGTPPWDSRRLLPWAEAPAAPAASSTLGMAGDADAEALVRPMWVVAIGPGAMQGGPPAAGAVMLLGGEGAIWGWCWRGGPWASAAAPLAVGGIALAVAPGAAGMAEGTVVWGCCVRHGRGRVAATHGGEGVLVWCGSSTATAAWAWGEGWLRWCGAVPWGWWEGCGRGPCCCCCCCCCCDGGGGGWWLGG